MDNLLSSFLRTHWLPVSLAVFGLIFLLYGLMSLSGQHQPQGDLVFDSATAEQGKNSQKEGSSASEKQITVDVEGAVQKPGVYHVAASARVQEALLKAGGISEKADRIKVAKTINLAGKLTDGIKLYIPFQGETTNGTSDPAIDDQAAGVININLASQKDLEGLPGVGEVTAQKIIGGRPYASLEELVSKKIISQKVLDQVRQQVSL